MTEQMTEQIMTEQITEQSESVKESRGGVIYKIVFPNGKHYIGMTIRSIEQRTKEHRNAAKRGDTQCVYNAIRKYNMVDTLELTEIDTADSFDELCELEIHYIEEYKSFYMDENKSYNMTRGGEGGGGYVFTEDDKQRMSENMKRYFKEPEKRQEMSEKIKRYFEDPEARKRHGESQRKRFENPEERLNHGKSQKKRYENPEERRMQGVRKKLYFEAHPEARRKMGEMAKKRNENPEEVKKALDTRGCNIPFDVFKCDGTYIGTFTYQFEAKEYIKREYGIVPNISCVLSGIRKSYNGFTFKYSDPTNIETMMKFQENKNEIKRKKASDAKGCNKPFDVFKDDGSYVGKFTYIFEAKEYIKKEYGKNVAISKVLSGGARSSRGFTFKYSDPLYRNNVNFDERNIENKKKRLDAKGKNKPFMVFKCDDESLVGEFTYEFEAREFLKKEYGNVPKIEDVEISRVLEGKTNSSKGFTFKYSDQQGHINDRYIEKKKKASDAKGRNKPFEAFKCDDGSLVGEFTYQFEAKEYIKKEYGIIVPNISCVLSGIKRSSKGFTFKYKKPSQQYPQQRPPTRSSVCARTTNTIRTQPSTQPPSPRSKPPHDSPHRKRCCERSPINRRSIDCIYFLGFYIKVIFTREMREMGQNNITHHPSRFIDSPIHNLNHGSELYLFRGYDQPIMKFLGEVQLPKIVSLFNHSW